jgi:hypothetical protein
MHSLQKAEFERDFDGQKTEHLGPLVAWVGCSLSKATSLGGEKCADRQTKGLNLCASLRGEARAALAGLDQ